jgi:hypothetical protein
MKRQATNARFVLLALGAVLGALVVLGFLRFKRYVDEDPRLCATCHRSSPEFALWLGGTHKTVACQSCHHSSPKQGVAMLGAFVAGKKPKGQHAEVEVGACASCHFSHDPRWPQVGGSRGHRIHYEEKKIACIRCHAASMHGFEPVAAKCVECHGEHAVSVAKMHTLHCFACHEFLTNEPGLRPTRHDCLRCHTRQGIRAPMKDHGAPMEMSCAACHKPHAKDGRTLVACDDCHKPAGMKKGGLHAKAAHRRCLDCHRPHVWTPGKEACARCHAGAAAHATGKACLECHSFAGAPRPPLPVSAW